MRIVEPPEPAQRTDRRDRQGRPSGQARRGVQKWTRQAIPGTAVALLAASLLACGGAYYSAWESLGRHKRDILVQRVRAGQADQREAEAQILSTYELFQEATGFQGGELESFYGRMDRAYEKSEARAADVRSRIATIDGVEGRLFSEWEGELGEIQNPELRERSAGQLRQTRDRYAELIASMRRAEQRMDPVLGAFRDQVLFLKHNLNASAIASLEGTAVGLEADVEALVRDMQASIREAESFLASLDG